MERLFSIRSYKVLSLMFTGISDGDAVLLVFCIY